MRGIEPRSDVASTGLRAVLRKRYFSAPMFPNTYIDKPIRIKSHQPLRRGLTAVAFKSMPGSEPKACSDRQTATLLCIASAKSVRLDFALIFLQRALTRIPCVLGTLHPSRLTSSKPITPLYFYQKHHLQTLLHCLETQYTALMVTVNHIRGSVSTQPPGSFTTNTPALFYFYARGGRTHP